MLRFALVLMFVASPAHADDTRARLAADVAAARTNLVRVRSELERDLRAAEAERVRARRAGADAVTVREEQLSAARTVLAGSRRRPTERGRKLELLARPVSRELATRFAMGEPRGCLVAKIKKTGSGYHAGVRAGDVVLSFDGRAVISPKTLSAQVAVAPRDRKIYLEVWRDRGVQILILPAVAEHSSNIERARVENARRELDRARRAHNTAIAEAEARVDRVRHDFGARLLAAEDNLSARQRALRAHERARFGVKMSPVAREVRSYYGVHGGAFVKAVEPGSRAEQFGVARGDIILRYGDVRVDDARHLSTLIKRRGGASKLEVIRDGDRRVLYADGRADTLELTTVVIPPAPQPRAETPPPRSAPPRAIASSRKAQAEPPRREPPAAPGSRRGRPPPRPSNTHLFPTLAFDRDPAPSAETPTGAVAEPPSASGAVPANRITATYLQNDTWKHVFANLEEFLGWHTAHGQPGRLLSHTAFDFHDAVDGGRVRVGRRDQECYVFDRSEPFDRFTVTGTRSYYNVKCHDEETFAF